MQFNGRFLLYGLYRGHSNAKDVISFQSWNPKRVSRIGKTMVFTGDGIRLACSLASMERKAGVIHCPFNAFFKQGRRRLRRAAVTSSILSIWHFNLPLSRTLKMQKVLIH